MIINTTFSILCSNQQTKGISCNDIVASTQFYMYYISNMNLIIRHENGKREREVHVILRELPSQGHRVVVPLHMRNL